MNRPIRRLLTIAAIAVVGALATTALTATASSASAPPTYHEPYRPQIHFSLPSGWIGDPNGLVYKDGLYYLYSFGTWQGAVSRDLTHWTNINVTGPAPDPGSNAFFSGSAVYDQRNTSGLGTRTHPPMVAIYTSVQASTGVQSQSIAYSTDSGHTWTRYAGDPVIDIHSVNFRDPKVSWYAPGHEWLMAVTLSDQYKVSFYTSPDLKNWSHTGDFGPAGATTGVWEMPDLYQLPVDGDSRAEKWVLSVSVGSTGVQYFVGQFDGSRFTPDGPASYTPPVGTTIADFETGDYGSWTTTGSAFGTSPVRGALPDQQGVTGFQGDYLVNSYNGGDASTGSLTSPAFTITKNHLNFLVGGGDNPYTADTAPSGTLPDGQIFADFSGPTYGAGWTGTGAFASSGPTTENLPNQVGASVLDTFTPAGDAGEGTITSPSFTVTSPYIDLQVAGGEHPQGQANPTAVNLIVGGKVIESATGDNTPNLTWHNWDVGAYQGQQAQIQVVDDSDGSGGWGHLMVGDIVFARAPAKAWDTQTSVNLIVDGQVVRSATGRNSESLDWNSWDVSALKDQQARIQIVDHATGGWGHVLADDFSLSDQPALDQIQRANWLDYGADFYAENTWNGAPGGQRVAVAWMNNWAYAAQVPTSPWQGAETFPRSLGLSTIDGKERVVQQPVSGLASLRTGPTAQARNVRMNDTTVPVRAQGQSLEIKAQLSSGSAADFGLNVRTGNGQYTQVGYDVASQELYVDRSHSGNTSFSAAFNGRNSAPLALVGGTVTLHIIVDASSVEVYADQGQVALTEQILPDPSSTGVSAFATGGSATLNSLTVLRLNSIWR